VRYSAAQASGASQEEADVSAVDKNALDYGLQTSLEDTTTVHIASRETCTCQMMSHLGLPCRHVQRVWLQENLLQVPAGAVDVRWIRRPEDSDELAIARLRSDALQRVREPPAPAVQRQMTADERFADVSALGLVLAEVAALSPALHRTISTKVRVLIDSAKSGTLELNSKSRRAKRPRASAAAGAAADEADGEEEAANEPAPASAPAPRPATLNPPGRAGPGERGKRKKGIAERAKAKGVKAAAAAHKAGTSAE
jgi:hypothetical protein